MRQYETQEIAWQRRGKIFYFHLTQGLTVSQIAERLGVTKWLVYDVLRAVKRKKRKRNAEREPQPGHRKTQALPV